MAGWLAGPPWRGGIEVERAAAQRRVRRNRAARATFQLPDTWHQVTIWRASAPRLTWCAHTPRALPQRRRSVPLSSLRFLSLARPVGAVPDPIERARGRSQLDLAGARGEGAEGFPAGRPLPDLRPEPECAPPPRSARCSPAPVRFSAAAPRAEESRSLPLLSPALSRSQPRAPRSCDRGAQAADGDAAPRPAGHAAHAAHDVRQTSDIAREHALDAAVHEHLQRHDAAAARAVRPAADVVARRGLGRAAADAAKPALPGEQKNVRRDRLRKQVHDDDRDRALQPTIARQRDSYHFLPNGGLLWSWCMKMHVLSHLTPGSL